MYKIEFGVIKLYGAFKIFIAYQKRFHSIRSTNIYFQYEFTIYLKKKINLNLEIIKMSIEQNPIYLSTKSFIFQLQRQELIHLTQKIQIIIIQH